MFVFGIWFAAIPEGLTLKAWHLFLGSYFSTLTPQGGSQNVIYVAGDYLTQGELYRLGLVTTMFCMLVFLHIGTPWILYIGA